MQIMQRNLSDTPGRQPIKAACELGHVLRMTTQCSRHTSLLNETD